MYSIGLMVLKELHCPTITPKNWFMSQRRAEYSFVMFRVLIIQDMAGIKSFEHYSIISRILDDAKIGKELLLRLRYILVNKNLQ